MILEPDGAWPPAGSDDGDSDERAEEEAWVRAAGAGGRAVFFKLHDAIVGPAPFGDDEDRGYDSGGEEWIEESMRFRAAYIRALDIRAAALSEFEQAEGAEGEEPRS